MRKLLLMSAIALTMGAVSCSTDNRDEPTTPTEKQDFTNANFIKSTLQGKWVETEWSYDDSQWVTINQYMDSNVYTFNGNVYTFQYSEDGGIDETGTYAITPVIGNNNAIVAVTENGSTYARKLYLLDYTDKVVTLTYEHIGSPTGRYYHKFKKQ